MAQIKVTARRPHWGWISAAVATVATVVGGLVSVIGYVQGIEQQQMAERAAWAAKNAVMEYRMDEVERDVAQERMEREHDVDQLRSVCK